MTLAQGMAVETPTPMRRGLPPWVAFGVCAGLLAAIGMSAWIIQKKLNVFLDRDPAPLHKSLSRLDKAQLAPYRFTQSVELNEEMVEALGTRDYIQWVLEDTRRSGSDPLRYAMLFITFYTGGRTQVPHTPERCFLGGGFAQTSSRHVSFVVPDIDVPQATRDVPAKALIFSKSLQQQIVLYTFYANCEFACERNYLRLALMKPGVPKAFFSKVEVVYGVGGGTSAVDPQKASAAAQELMQVVLPVLMREHWPHPDELMATKKAPTVP